MTAKGTALVCMVLLSMPVMAHAVAVTQFALNGTFLDNTTVTGTFGVDTITGTVLTANFLYNGQTFSTVLFQFPFDCCADPNSLPVGYGLAVGTTSSVLPALRFLLSGTTAVDSLVGYTGGNVCSDTLPCGPDSDGNFWESGYRDPSGNGIGLNYGSVTPVPEPASLALLGSGLLAGLGAIRWRIGA